MVWQLPARAEVVSVIIEEVPCDCITTTTTASTTSLSACPSSSTSSSSSSSSSSTKSTTSSNHASSSSVSPSNNNTAIPPSSIAALPSLPSTESGIRTLTQTISQPSTTFTTTVIFTPNPEEPQSPNNNGLHPTLSSETFLSTPDVIAIIVLVSVAGTALFYIIYRVYIAQRMNPAPTSWRRAWVIGESKWGEAMREELEEVRISREERVRLEELRVAAARREREERLRLERERRLRREQEERMRREQEHNRRQGPVIVIRREEREIVRPEEREENLRRGRREQRRQGRREGSRRGSRERLQPQ